jgi:hypothetical protein
MRSLDIDARHAVRSADLAARWDSVICGLDHATDGVTALALADDIDALLKTSTDASALSNWRLASGLLRALALDLSIRASAKSGAADVGADRTRLQVLLQEAEEIVGDLEDERLQSSVRGSYDASKPQVNRKTMLAALVRLPLPTLYLAEERDRWPSRFAERCETASPRIPVLRLAAFLDNAPITATQRLRPHTLHTLRFQIKGTEWPKQAQLLRVELLCTCPPTLFHVSTFETRDRSGSSEFEATLSGSIQFDASQSEGAADLVVAVRAAFSMQDGSVCESPIIGHSQLRFRVSYSEDSENEGDATQPLSANSRLRPGQFEVIQNALLAAFTRESLKRMLRTKLDVRLDHIASNGTLVDVIYEVIEWAERDGKIAQLVQEATAFIPQNEELNRIATEFERTQSCL